MNCEKSSRSVKLLQIECGRVGCDEAVGDGKSKGCLMLAELEFDTCWDWHPCLSMGQGNTWFTCRLPVHMPNHIASLIY